MFNQVILGGRLVRDPEHKVTGNGTSVCRFSIAVERNYKNAEGKKDADFINCTAWRDTADNINKYFKKGDLILTTGRWQVNSVVDEDTNQKKNYNECVVESFSFIPRGKKEDNTDSDGEESTSGGKSGGAGGFRRKK